MNDEFVAHLLGVRGSTPVFGTEFLRYGGATSCVALSHGGDPDLILDAGTALRDLGTVLAGTFRGAVLLTHLHWDHVQGLPFADALLDPLAEVDVVVPVEEGVDPVDALLPQFSPPAFPVRPDELSPSWRFSAARSETAIGGWTVRSAPVRHKGGRTLAIRVGRSGRSLVYLPDHDLSGDDPPALALAAGADLLIHDAQYLEEEIGRYGGFGHSTIEKACDFADAAAVGRLVLTHHAPSRSDVELDAIADSTRTTRGGIPVSVAHQGDTLHV